MTVGPNFCNFALNLSTCQITVQHELIGYLNDMDCIHVSYIDTPSDINHKLQEFNNIKRLTIHCVKIKKQYRKLSRHYNTKN